MIYLFNSAYRPLHQRNLLKTISLPSGWVNEYRYQLDQNVASSIIPVLDKLKNNPEVAINFIDRYGKDAAGHGLYKYYPIRKAKFLSYQSTSQQLFIRVRLDDYIFPKDIESFTSQFVKLLSTVGLPQLTNNDPAYKKDGYYVFLADSVFTDTDLYHTGDTARTNFVNALVTTHAYISSIQKHYLITKLELHDTSPKRKLITPRTTNNPWYIRLIGKINDGEPYYKLIADRKYQLCVYYQFPIQQLDSTVTGEMTIAIGGDVQSLPDPRFRIDSLYNRFVFPVVMMSSLVEKKGSISLSFKSSDTNHVLVAPEFSIDCVSTNSFMYWIALIFLGLLFAACSIIIGIDFTKLQPFDFIDYWNTNYFKVIFAVIQTLALIGWFRLTREKLF